MKLAHLVGISQVPSGSMTATAAAAVMMRLTSLSCWGMEPPPKKARFGALLGMSSRYACGAAYPFHGFFAPPIFVSKLKI
jgi:hypothetical protein